MAIWFNQDGLAVKFVAADFLKYGGEYSVLGDNHEWCWQIDLTKFAAGTYLLSDGLKLPKGFEWEKAEIYVDDAAAGGTSISVGGYNTNQTVNDAGGFVTAVNGALANLTNGATVNGTGAYVGTVTSAILIPSITVAGTFSDGNIRIRLSGHVSTDI